MGPAYSGNPGHSKSALSGAHRRYPSVVSGSCAAPSKRGLSFLHAYSGHHQGVARLRVGNDQLVAGMDRTFCLPQRNQSRRVGLSPPRFVPEPMHIDGWRGWTKAHPKARGEHPRRAPLPMPVPAPCRSLPQPAAWRWRSRAPRRVPVDCRWGAECVPWESSLRCRSAAG